VKFVLLKARAEQVDEVVEGKREAIVQVASQEEVGVLRRPWFTRAQVLELVLSQDPWVQCDCLRARWIDLCALLLGLKEQQVQTCKSPIHPSQYSGKTLLASGDNVLERLKSLELDYRPYILLLEQEATYLKLLIAS
jgi:hypothetical protein